MLGSAPNTTATAMLAYARTTPTSSADSPTSAPPTRSYDAAPSSNDGAAGATPAEATLPAFEGSRATPPRERKVELERTMVDDTLSSDATLGRWHGAGRPPHAGLRRAFCPLRSATLRPSCLPLCAEGSTHRPSPRATQPDGDGHQVRPPTPFGDGSTHPAHPRCSRLPFVATDVMWCRASGLMDRNAS
jgi:hypothetical protein